MHTQIQKNVFSFLKDLKKNNNREWFADHKEDFKTIQKTVKDFYEHLLASIRMHDDVDRLKVFRIYRDVRFSKDKTPYKTHFGGSFHRTKPKLRGGYYLHIAPKDSFIATGFWQPDKNDLFRIRKEFETDDTEVRKIINASEFKAIWGTLKGDEVKTAPKGFDKEHAAIDLIKKKQHIFTRAFTDAEVTDPNFVNVVNDSFKAIRPYFDYMSDVLTTDLNGVSTIS